MWEVLFARLIMCWEAQSRTMQRSGNTLHIILCMSAVWCYSDIDGTQKTRRSAGAKRKSSSASPNPSLSVQDLGDDARADGAPALAHGKA